MSHRQDSGRRVDLRPGRIVRSDSFGPGKPERPVLCLVHVEDSITGQPVLGRQLMPFFSIEPVNSLLARYCPEISCIIDQIREDVVPIQMLVPLGSIKHKHALAPRTKPHSAVGILQDGTAALG